MPPVTRHTAPWYPCPCPPPFPHQWRTDCRRVAQESLEMLTLTLAAHLASLCFRLRTAVRRLLRRPPPSAKRHRLYSSPLYRLWLVLLYLLLL